MVLKTEYLYKLAIHTTTLTLNILSLKQNIWIWLCNHIESGNKFYDWEKL